MNGKKILLPALFLILVFGSIVSVLWFWPGKQEIRKGAADQPHLYLEQSDDTSQSRVELDLYVDTAGEEINGVDAIIDYDPEVLEFVSVTKGYFFDAQPQFEFREEGGRVYIYSIAPNPLTTETGQSKVAQIMFDIKKQQETNLSFVCDLGNLNHKSSAIWQGKEAVNIIDCSSLTDFTFSTSEDLSPTVTGEPSVTLTPTEPVSTATPEPTGEPTAAPTDMPEVTTTPSPTPEPDKAVINFKLSLQGIEDSSSLISNPVVDVIVKDSFSTVADFSGVELFSRRIWIITG